jgi:hypothetical protein
MSKKNLARTALEGGHWRGGWRMRRNQNVKLAWRNDGRT